MLHLCFIVLSNRRVVLVATIPSTSELLLQYFYTQRLMVHTDSYLIVTIMLVQGKSDHGDHTSLALLYDAWVIFINSKWSLVVPEEDRDTVGE